MNYPQIKPTLNLDFSNTKTLDPRINFRRGTPGAYYDGKTYAKAEENLISYSEKFDQAGTSFGLWSSLNVNLTTDSTNEFLAPDGTQTAWKISDSDTSNSSHSLFQQVYTTDSSQEILTTSIFAKAGDANRYLQLFLGTDDTNYGFPFANFDLFTGTITKNEETLNASMIDVGNGWYRCSITFFTTTVSGKNINPVFYMIDNPSAARDEYYAGDGSSGLYIWGAQLEQRDSVTSYTKTDGTPKTKYQPQLMFASPDKPRFDHDVLTGESKGLLIEESRTNLITYSQQIEKQSSSGADYNVWVVSSTSNALFELNSSIAPDGTLSASKFYADDLSNNPGIYQQTYTTDTTPETLTFSVFAKAGQANRYLQLFTGSGDVDGDPFVNFNLFDGTISRDDDSIGSIVDIGNGWYRCIITFVTTSTGDISINPVIYLIDNANATRAPSMTGDGYSGIFIWGAQIEQGSFPTSYIKTSGASATRSADNASITGENFSSWYRQDEGSLYSEVNTLASSSHSRISMSDGTSSNRIFISNGIYPLYINKNGDIQVRESSDAIVNVYSKRAAGLKKNDFALSIDGGDPLVDTSGDLPLVDRLAFSTSHTSDNYVNGHIKKLSYYPQRLTNEQLQNLTK